MKRHLIATLLVIMSATLVAAPVSAQGRSQQNNALTVPVTGIASGGSFAGTFQLLRFVNRGGDLAATGVLTGTLTNTATGVTTSVVRTVTLPAVVTNATCDILHLDLGPLSLDLLGLQVDLSQIVLDITAESGRGNLLGNLLCAVANLLNNPSGLARLLNQILGALLG